MLGNTEKHTIHNNIPTIQTSFSSIVDEPVDDFQSAHMIQKIKKIRKKKQKQNITGMADFDVLTNTPNSNTPIVDARASAHPAASSSSADSSPSMFSVEYWKQQVFGKTIEGAKNYFEDSEYEGRDNLKEPESKSFNVKDKIIRGINSVYNAINSVNQTIAAGIVNGISVNTATKKDIAIVRNQIALVESALVSSWMVYNWYYLMHYAKDTGKEIPAFSRIELLKNFNGGIGKLLLYLFEFALWFPEKLDQLLLQWIPNATSWFLNGTCQFLLIYILCLIWTKNFAIAFKNFFIDLLTDATGNMLINLMFGIVFILFIISMFTLNFIGEVKHDAEEVVSIVNAIANPIGSFFKLFFRFLITIIISVPMGAVICGLYLIIYSLFGVYIYGGVSWGWSSARKDIDEHLRNANAGFQEEDMCNSGGLMAFILAILRFLFKIVDYVKEHLLKAVFLVIFFNSSISMSNNFSNGMQNRSLFIFFNIIITIALAILVWVSMVTYVKHDAGATDLPNTSAPNVTPTSVNTADIIKQAIIANTTPQTELFLNADANNVSNASLANPVASRP
jgi:hypothetical protein